MNFTFENINKSPSNTFLLNSNKLINDIIILLYSNMTDSEIENFKINKHLELYNGFMGIESVIRIQYKLTLKPPSNPFKYIKVQKLYKTN